MRSRDICHRVRQQAVAGAAGCDNGRMHDPSSHRGTGLVGFRRYTWWSLTGTTAFVLVVLLGRRILTASLPAWAAAACAVALAVTTVAGVVLLSRRLADVAPDGRPAGPPLGWVLAGAGSAAVLGGILLPLADDGVWAVAPATMVAVLATFLSPRRRGMLLAAAGAVAAALGGIAALAPESGAADGWLGAVLLPPLILAIAATSVQGMLWGWDVAARLEGARRLSAELAVADERLRFAADLHDIQGHHLQVIALKSELAARLARTDPARAVAEMEEVRRLAAEALDDTRAVVQGYRRTSLDDEIANATRVLAAAGIDARMNLEPTAAAGPDRLATAGRHLLGLVMREATTNVLRHSQARHAVVDYGVTGGGARLRVTNDGVTDRPSTGAGTGLRTLAGRLEAAGGELTWEHGTDRFVVTALLPVHAGAEGASPEGTRAEG
jgi:two-component system, NarL family, sensor histidine kinase DesK